MIAPTQLFIAGYRDLVSVIPPGAALDPGSKIAPASIGKVPGRKVSDQFWAGFGWQDHDTTLDDVRRWEADGANFGLRAGRFPGLDIDSLDEGIAAKIEEMALRVLGPAPVRVGKPPKRLLMYRTDEPFARMRISLEAGNQTTHLIELLGDGQQYLVVGTHPTTMRPYEWSASELPAPADLTPITRAMVATLFDEIASEFRARGFSVHREGDGRRRERTMGADQAALLAPSLEKLAEVVALLPNTDQCFGARDDYIKFGAAVRAACGDDVEGGFEIFLDWCNRWETETGKTNEPETVRADWLRLYPPFAVGWPWLVELARGFGYNNAPDEFPAEGSPPDRPRVTYSDQWLADKAIARMAERLRHVPVSKRWLVWDGRRWQPDDMNNAQREVSEILHEMAYEVVAAGATREAYKEARRIESTAMLRNVMTLMQADSRVTVPAAALDGDLWLLNTPLGVVDLRTGLVRKHDPALLMTKLTRVSVDRQGECPLWTKFLHEAAGGNPELVAYLQRLAGYCLTGMTDEHAVVFVYGPGGNGKSVFLNTLTHIIGDYATTAAMSTFLATRSDRHPTEVAALQGARLVTASETSDGRWNEERLKSLSGGDPVTARLLYRDFSTFQPQFKLLLVGNRKPSLDTVDDAMRRRLHLVPFTVKPRQPDPFLTEKLRAEAPAILAWMVDGALEWNAQRLSPPEVVHAATKEYFEDQDVLGRWLAEECEEAADALTLTQHLFASWKEWCGERGEYVGSLKRLSQKLADRGLKRDRDPKGRWGFVGIRLLKQPAIMTLDLGQA